MRRAEVDRYTHQAMAGRIVTVLGAGNVRCAPPVFATLSNWYPDVPLAIRLWDANEERLDLMDRLARCLMDDWNSEATVTSTTDIEEALPGTTDAILCLHEDCARRLIGTHLSPSLAMFDDQDIPLHFYGGDRNRPTPPESLSEHTKLLLSVPDHEEFSRAEAMTDALKILAPHIPDAARVVSLMRETEMESVETLAWPEILTETQSSLIPHQILRWVRRDEELFDLMSSGKSTPLRAWLDQVV
jgi:hypothetical protein